VDAYRAKLDALAGAHATVESTPVSPPADLLALVLGVAGAWFSTSDALRTLDAKDPWSPKRLAQSRDTAVEAVRRLLSPPKRRPRMSSGASSRSVSADT
jgi:hypothetical protein